MWGVVSLPVHCGGDALTKLPLRFMQGLKAGSVIPGEKPGEELVVTTLKKNDELRIPPGLMVAYVGVPPDKVSDAHGGCAVRPRPGTVAITTLPEPGHTTRVYLVTA